MNELSNQNNIGSIQSINILVLPENHQPLKPDANNEVDLSLVQINENYPFLFSYQSASLSFDKKPTPNGDLFEIDLICFVPKIRKEVLKNLEDLNLLDFLVLIKDGNNSQFLIGNTKYPVKITFNHIIPNEANGFNHSKITFISKQPHDILAIK